MYGHESNGETSDPKGLGVVGRDQAQSKRDLFIKASNVGCIERKKRNIFEVAVLGLQLRVVVIQLLNGGKAWRKQAKGAKPFKEVWMGMAESAKPLPFAWNSDGDSQDN